MPYPLIILGAGASYDSIKIERYELGDQQTLKMWRPPLTNNIFDVSRFSRIIGKYDDVKSLASTIINIVDSNIPFDFEKYLSEEEIKYPEKSYPQIIALRFYLAELLSKVSYHFYNHTNNHRHLIDQTEKIAGKAVVVNFNYDTLFEKNINYINNNKQIDSYISGDIKVIKIHGAHNWRFTPIVEISKNNVYEYFISKGQELNKEYKNHEIYPIIMNNFDYSSEDFDLNKYREYTDGSLGGIWSYYLPAIAIPIASKAEYICPESHISMLNTNLPMIDRILIIGWRAQDEYLLKLLKENLKDNIQLTIVSSNEKNAGEIALKFNDIKQIKKENITISKSEGYTNFMINREYEQFLNK